MSRLASVVKQDRQHAADRASSQAFPALTINMSWQGGKETGENGEAVLLFAPISTTGSTPSNETGHGPSSSSIGGLPAYFATDEDRVMQCITDECSGGSKDDTSSQSKAPQCHRCRLPMLLVAQVNAPVECQNLDRSLYVFGCNRAKCWREATQGAANENGQRSAVANRFLVGGSGVVRCLRSQEHSMASITSDGNVDADTTNAAAIGSDNLKTQPDDISGWGVDGEDGDNASENGWGADDWGESSNPCNEDGTMDDLEAMLTACEMKEENTKATKSKGKKNASKTITGNKDGRAQSQVEGPAMGQFARFALDMYDEPYANHRPAAYHESDGDDDDDAIGTAGASDDKIQKMLSRYLKDEEDQDIVQALGGAASSSTTSGKTGSSGGGGSGGGEKYERLPPEERAFLAFTDRIKRSPEQVLRYAYGGVPIWSVPTHDIGGQKTQKGGKQKVESPPFPHVNPCSCGRDRIFEFEVLPSILFALNVDIHAKTYPQSSSQGNSNSTAESSEDSDMEQKMNGGGMDWGALAVYSCPDSCESSREEFVVAQSSVDGTPTRREFTSIPAADTTNEED